MTTAQRPAAAEQRTRDKPVRRVEKPENAIRARENEKKNPVASETFERDLNQPEKVSAELRHQMIAEAAFLQAEKRGFQGGDPVSDWLEAEKSVDRSLTG